MKRCVIIYQCLFNVMTILRPYSTCQTSPLNNPANPDTLLTGTLLKYFNVTQGQYK